MTITIGQPLPGLSARIRIYSESPLAKVYHLRDPWSVVMQEELALCHRLGKFVQAEPGTWPKGEGGRTLFPCPKCFPNNDEGLQRPYDLVMVLAPQSFLEQCAKAWGRPAAELTPDVLAKAILSGLAEDREISALEWSESEDKACQA